MIHTIRRAATVTGLAAAGVVLTASVAATSAMASTPTPSPSPGGSAGATTVMVHNGPYGQYLTDGKGRSLYRFAADTGSTSTCYGQCAVVWPPLLTNGKPTAGSGVQAAKLSTTTRNGGGTQVTYFGHPLYFFTADTAPGMTNGQGVNNLGGLWWLVSPSGNNITAKSPSSTMHTSAPATHTSAPATGGGGIYGH